MVVDARWSPSPKSELNIMLGPRDLKVLLVRRMEDGFIGTNVVWWLSFMCPNGVFESFRLSEFSAACSVKSLKSEVAASGSCGRDSCSDTAGISLAQSEDEEQAVLHSAPLEIIHLESDIAETFGTSTLIEGVVAIVDDSGNRPS